MEMLREVDETVDFIPNYDGRGARADGATPAGPQPAGTTVRRAPRSAWQLPSRRTTCVELADAVFWALENHDADEERPRPRSCGAG